VLLCDEPTGDLDRASADAVLDLLSTLVAEHKTTVLMVTHDPRAAERASAIVRLEKGALVGSTPAPLEAGRP
jgi:putative ABC transport system ATP-binding protein